MSKIEIIPMSKQTKEGKWVPETRFRVHFGDHVDDTPLYDADNKLFDTKEAADAHSMAMGRRHAEKMGFD